MTLTVFLIGLSGSGKSTAGQLLAESLGWAFIDTDAEVEREAGRSVADIFAGEGEAGFRARERRALVDAVGAAGRSGGGALVVTVGGGAVLDPVNQEILRGPFSLTVWLRGTPLRLAHRLGDSSGRPLLASSDDGRGGGGTLVALERLESQRGDVYSRLAEAVIDVDELSPHDVVSELHEVIAAASGGLIRVPVSAGDLGYTVLVGRGAASHLPELLPAGARRAAVVTQESVPFEVELPIAETRFVIEDGEAAKTLATVESLCRAFAAAGLTRSDVVVSVGGGVVSDVAGFAASVYHRGVSVVHVPTTLLAQVDAAIGGKTGVNLPEGKNLVGSFWQPAGVCCDTAALDSLPEGELRSGRGEMVKYAFIGVPDLAALSIEQQVARCVALKARVVAVDERESSGRRMVLNYGHTLAHALETAQFSVGGELRHGEAVAIGLVYASRLACRLGRIGAARVDEHVELVSGAGLPVAIPQALASDHGQLVKLMRRDKKSSGGLTFVLDGPDGVEPVHDVAEEAVLETLAEMEVE